MVRKEITHSSALLWCRRFRRALRGVVVNDAPSFGEFLQNQGEDSADVADLALQVPMAENERGVRPKRANFQFREIELSHCCAVGVGLLITFEYGFPSTRESFAASKGQLC